MDSQFSLTLQVISLSAFLFTSFICLYFLIKYKHKLTQYYLSTVHAIFASIYGYIGLSKINFINEFSIIFVICGHISLGYFCIDLLNILCQSNRKGSFTMILHHIVFSGIIIWMIYAEKYHLFGLSVMLTELSTIFLNSYQFTLCYSETHIEFRKYIKMQAILFMFVFFLIRIVFLTNLAINYLWLILTDDILTLCGIFTLSINYYWFWRIIKKIMN